MTQSKPARGRPGYDVDTLLSVAVEVFNDRGYDGTSMEDLAKATGLLKADANRKASATSHCTRRCVRIVSSKRVS